MRMILAAIISGALLLTVDTLLTPAVLLAVKEPLETDGGPLRTTLHLREIEGQGIKSPRSFSAIVPGLDIPDYGSAMTSTIYLRGFGSRMENPVMGLYVDDVPVLDKNAYDFDFQDVRCISVLRGPQGTLFGRNALMGVMSVETLSPDVWQGARGTVECGNGQTAVAKLSLFSGDIGIAGSFSHRGGFYLNDYNGKLCDPSDGASFRLRWGKVLPGAWTVDQILHASWIRQGGYPYRQIEDGKVLPVNYNDTCGYGRFYSSESLRVLHQGDLLRLKSVTALQLLADRMDLDQDFTAESLFTLQQRQRQWAVSEEITIEPAIQHDGWKCRTGFFTFLKGNRMSAPVTFKSDGIDNLILSNANTHIPDYLGTLELDERTFIIGSNFDIMTLNLAAFHESVMSLNNWELSVGIRADLELDRMDYASDATVHFRLAPAMEESYPCRTQYAGREPSRSFQLLPKIALSRCFEGGGWSRRLAVSWAEGYRAGGFNTQIFSDILQNKMMNGMMSLCGVHLNGAETVLTAENTVYKPEYSDNFELDGAFGYASGDFRMDASAGLFCILVRNQQITVFPEGLSTGRMMRNAGRSRSLGVESTIALNYKHFHLDASYGLTDARFTIFHDGNHDWSGKRIPYSPRQTLSLLAALETGQWLFQVRLKGIGDIYWNEENSLRQPFYQTLAGSVTYRQPHFSVHLRGENLTGKQIPVFYFKSVGREFYQFSRPAMLTLGIDFEIFK